jgi:hypothetical protein
VVASRWSWQKRAETEAEGIPCAFCWCTSRLLCTLRCIRTFHGRKRNSWRLIGRLFLFIWMDGVAIFFLGFIWDYFFSFYLWSQSTLHAQGTAQKLFIFALLYCSRSLLLASSCTTMLLHIYGSILSETWNCTTSGANSLVGKGRQKERKKESWKRASNYWLIILTQSHTTGTGIVTICTPHLPANTTKQAIMHASDGSKPICTGVFQHR